MKLYQVVWDEEYNGNCHDEILTNALPEEEAIQYATLWSERKVLSAFPTITKGSDLFNQMVTAKRQELSLMEVEVPKEKLDKVELKLNAILINAIENGADDLKDKANEALANHFGDESYCKREIQSAGMLLTAMKRAKENGLTKVTLIFEKE